MSNSFEVIITQQGLQTEQAAIANATRTLTQLLTEINTEIKDIFNVETYDGDGQQEDFGIALHFVLEPDHDENEVLKHLYNSEPVETVEEVHYELS